jgi:type IV secretion system protein VirB5
MKNVSTFIVAGAVAMVLVTATPVIKPAHAGIPVADIPAVAQRVIDMIQKILHYANEIRQLEAQVKNAEKTLESLSSVRGLAGLIDSEYGLDLDSIEFEDLLDEYNIQSADAYDVAGEIGSLLDKKNRSAAEWEAKSKRFLEDAVTRFDELQGLISEVDSASDPKDVMDLQARIQGEQALLQNESIKLQMMESEARAQQSMLEQQSLQYHLQMKTGSNSRF